MASQKLPSNFVVASVNFVKLNLNDTTFEISTTQMTQLDLENFGQSLSARFTRLANRFPVKKVVNNWPTRAVPRKGFCHLTPNVWRFFGWSIFVVQLEIQACPSVGIRSRSTVRSQMTERLLRP